MLPIININDFNYDLPEERIARYPLPERDASRLLVWKNGAIAHRVFRELPDLLSGDEVMFFNNTKVIPARMYFRKETGGLVEIFLLSPYEPPVVDLAMRSAPGLVWACTIGNLKRWIEGVPLRRTVVVDGEEVSLTATLVDRGRQLVRFDWDRYGLPFAKLVEACGEAPIPPYLNRSAEESDKSAYQTVYGKREGAVAAPTAGLHFTPAVMDRLQQKGVHLEELTLHVSAGTFRPVKAENAIEHDMHAEQVVVRRHNLEALLAGRPVVAVGTTSMRTLESIYWYGVRLLTHPDADFVIEKLAPYEYKGAPLPSMQTAAAAVLNVMEKRDMEELWGSTEIYIFPGYQFRVVDALVTNFHQPCSTLLLLISAFTGGDAWKDVYREALSNGYRFLSYGDSSLLYKG
jgi:S-adenosylmethionine:tRNA ribosyltransferase-isomerase